MSGQLVTTQELLTVDEVAAQLKVCRAQAYNLVASGALPSIRLGKRKGLRVSVEALREHLRERAKRPAALPAPTPVAPLLSVAEAAAVAGISQAAAYRWVASGEMPGAVQINGRWHIRRAIFQRWLDGEGA